MQRIYLPTAMTNSPNVTKENNNNNKKQTNKQNTRTQKNKTT